MHASFRITFVLRLFVSPALGILLQISASRLAYAQQLIPRPIAPAERSSTPSDAFPTNHKFTRQLLAAQAELADKKYQIGLRRLGLILGAERARRSTNEKIAGEDFFFTTTPEDVSTFRSLKSTALELIENLPPAGRKAYEDLYGHHARAQLQAAIDAADLDRIRDVARRFFHTAAGYEAVYRLATRHMDHSRPLAAARGFARLRRQKQATARWNPLLSLKEAICWARIGQAGKSADLMAGLRLDHPEATIELGGERFRLFDESKAERKTMDRLFAHSPHQPARAAAQWALYGGNPARNAIEADLFPLLRAQWQIPAVDNKAVRRIVADWEQAVHRAGDLSITAVQPVIVDQTLIVKTVGDETVSFGGKIRAIDLRTGKILWQTYPDVGFDPMPPSPTFTGASPASVPNLIRDTVTKQRVWHDQTFGNLSSDGRLVFSVEELGAFRPARQAATAPLRPFNVLRAYAVRGGKAEWEIGGEPGGAVLPLGGTFFLGPPLPMNDRLYCLGEQDRQLKLIVLDAASGELQWSQSLLAVNSEYRSLNRDFWRRVTGIGPAYSQGILVCPTGVGGIVGVDLENRLLLWHFFYRYDPNTLSINPSRRSPLGPRLLPGQSGNHWLDSTPIIADNRIVLTPRDVSELYCLDLLTGKLHWRKPKLDRLQVVGIQDQKVIVVGREEIEFFHLFADGDSALPQPISIPAPSGRALLADGKLLVPLSTAEVISVDVKHGRIARRASSPAGLIPGNLLCHRQTVVSVGTDSIVGFDNLKHAEEQIGARLAKNPQDNGALVSRAKILYQKGDLFAARAELRRALKQDNSRATRELFKDVLLAGLKTDFARFRNSNAEIERLLGSPEKKMADILEEAQTNFALNHDQLSQLPDLLARQSDTAIYLRRLGDGLAAAGEISAALDVYRRYVSAENEDAFDQVDSSVAIRRDRWLGARLTKLLRSLPSDQRKEIDQRVAMELEAALTSTKAETLRRFLIRFGGHPSSVTALRAMVDASAEGIDPLESEFTLLRLRDSGDKEQAAFATAKLASLLLDADRVPEAVPYLRALESHWSSVTALDGKTGHELVESWRRDPFIAREFSDKPLWPTGPVQIEKQPNSNRNAIAYRHIPVVESRNGPDQPLDLRWDIKSHTLSAHNSRTEQVWQLAFGGRQRSSMWEFSSYARANGHLTLLMLGAKIVAVDTLGWSGEHQARILWDRTLVDPYRATNNIRFSQNPAPMDMRGRKIGALGPITEDCLFYQEGRTIVAADPLTGEKLWQRSGFDYGSEMFADEDRLMVVAPHARTARFYRRGDGSFLGTRAYLAGLQQIATLDGHLIGLQYSDNLFSILSRNVWTNKNDWKQEFPLRSLYARVGPKELAVLRPDGRFVVLNVNNGRATIETKIESEPKVQSIAVQASAENYVLIVNHPTEASTKAFIRLGNPWSVLVNGTIHGIDRRTGIVRWSTQISNQAVDLKQPADLPILVLSSRITPDPRRSRFSFELLCLDKRTGQILFESEPARIEAIVRYEADLDNKTVQIDLLKSSIHFTFNTEPNDEKLDNQGDQP